MTEQKLRAASNQNPGLSMSDSFVQERRSTKKQETGISRKPRESTSNVTTGTSNASMIINNLTKFVPSLVIQKLVEQVTNPSYVKHEPPELQKMETVVIFADISGFTKLSERCGQEGRQGNETLAFCINRYIEDMVNCLNQYGGDIIKFVGDAIIVMWPPIDTQDQQYPQLRLDCIRRALQCTVEIQKAMNNMQVMPGVSLSVKIGVGYGECAILYVGGVFGRQETLTVGEALVFALRSENVAGDGGEVIVSESCFKHIHEQLYRGQEIIAEDGLKFYKLDLKFRGQRIKGKSDVMKIMSKFSLSDLLKASDLLAANVPHCALPFIKINQQQFASENRSLTVMFITLGVDLSLAANQEGIHKIQKIVVAVQQQIYRLEGSLNKLVMDDKGSTMIVIFGLPPYAHDDDASRAIYAGFNMIKALSKIEETYCNIGIASGECFCGIVGGSGSRKEFSVLGDIVNLSARIMGAMKYQKNEITCDQNTRMMAENNFSFTYAQHHELKGKSISTPFYKPVDPRRHTEEYHHRFMPVEHFLKPHQNPLIIPRDEKDEHQSKATIGFDDLLEVMTQEIKDYFADEDNLVPYVAMIQGEIGSGKTAFMRHLFEKMIEEIEQFGDVKKLPLFGSMINPESRLHYLNAWRSVFTMIVKYYCKNEKLNKHHFIGKLIEKEKVPDLAELIMEITGVELKWMKRHQKELLKSAQQVQPIPNEKDGFTKTPEYRADDTDRIVNFFTQLFKYCCGDASEVVSGWGSDDDDQTQSAMNSSKRKETRKQSQMKNSDDSQTSENTADPIMVCIDNAHLMDATSWKLLGELTQEQSHVAFFLVIKYDYRDRLLVVPEAKQAFDEAWNLMTTGGEINIRMAEMPTLTQEDVRKLILKSATQYIRSHRQELDSKTEMLNPDSIYKTPEMGVEWRKILTQQWQLEKPYEQIDPQVLEIITTKCRGNPFLCLDYFKQMLQSDFISQDETGCLRPTKQFERCVKFDDWSTLVTPQLSKKISAQIISSFLHTMSKKPGYAELLAVAVVLVKSASVLGKEFSMDALKYISTFPRDHNYDKRMDEAICALEKADLIEIVNSSNSGLKFRFVQTLMQETLYQLLRYKPIKKDMHKEVENFIQQNPSKMILQPGLQRSDQLLWHMLLAQDTKEEDGLTLERRNALTVMRIQEKLRSQPPGGIIMAQQLFKAQSTGVHGIHKKAASALSRFLVLKRDQISWYHNQQEFKEGKFTGIAKLNFVYDTMKTPTIMGPNQQPLHSFRLSVSMHSSKKKQVAGDRILDLASSSILERDQWLAAIDYLKTKAIYDHYSKNNALVNFMGHDSDLQNDAEDDERNLNELLYDFGGQLKTATMVKQGVNKITGGLQQFCQRRGTAMYSDNSSFPTGMNLGTQKAPELKEKLKLLYHIGLSSFLHQMSTTSLRGNNQVLTSDEDVQRSPMQFPPNLIAETRRKICELEKQPYDEMNEPGLNFFQSGRRASVASNKMIQRRVFAEKPASNQSSETKFEQRNNVRASQTFASINDLSSQLPPNMSKKTPTQPALQNKLQSTELLVNKSQRDILLTKGPLDSFHYTLTTKANPLAKEVRRISSFSAEQASILQQEYQVNDGIQEESDSEDESFERDIMQDIKIPDKPFKSGNIAQLNVTPESLERVSEQLANIEDRKGNQSDNSQQVTQLQYETSDLALAGNKQKLSKPDTDRDLDSQNLIDLFNGLQNSIDHLAQDQRALKEKVNVHQNLILSPTNGQDEQFQLTFNSQEGSQLQKLLEIMPLRSKTSELEQVYSVAVEAEVKAIEKTLPYQHNEQIEKSTDLANQFIQEEEKKQHRYISQQTAQFRELEMGEMCETGEKKQLTNQTMDLEIEVATGSSAQYHNTEPSESRKEKSRKALAAIPQGSAYFDPILEAICKKHMKGGQEKNGTVNSTEDIVKMSAHILEVPETPGQQATIRTRGHLPTDRALGNFKANMQNNSLIQEQPYENSPSPRSDHVLLLDAFPPDSTRFALSEFKYHEEDDVDAQSEYSNLSVQMSNTVKKPINHRRNQLSGAPRKKTKAPLKELLKTKQQ